MYTGQKLRNQVSYLAIVVLAMYGCWVTGVQGEENMPLVYTTYIWLVLCCKIKNWIFYTFKKTQVANYTLSYSLRYVYTARLVSCTVCVLVDCTHLSLSLLPHSTTCKMRALQSSGQCSNAFCPSHSSSSSSATEPHFSMPVALSDHTAGLEGERLAGKAASDLLKLTVRD